MMDSHASNHRRSPFRLVNGLGSTSAIAAALLAASFCAAHSFGTLQDGIRIRNISSADSNGATPGAADFLVRTARIPVFVEIDLGGSGTPQLPEAAASRVVAVLDANPRRLVTLKFKGAALRFEDLSRGTREILLDKRGDGVVDAYNEYLAGQVLGLTNAIDSARPGSPLAIQGLPFEGRNAESAKANEAYGEVLERMDAIVLGGGMMVSGASDEASMLHRAYPHSVNLADGRAILFASNGGWRIATRGARTDDSALAVDDSLEGGADIPLESPKRASADSNDAMGEAAVLGSPSSGDFPAGGGIGDASSQDVGSDAGNGARDAGSPAAQGGGGGGGAGGGGGGSAGGGGSGSAAGPEAEEDASSDVDAEATDPDEGTSGDGNGSEIDNSNTEGEDAGSSGGEAEEDESGSSASDDSSTSDDDEWDPEDEVDESGDEDPGETGGDVDEDSGADDEAGGSEEGDGDGPGAGGEGDSSDDEEQDQDSEGGESSDEDAGESSALPFAPIGSGPVGTYPALPVVGNTGDFGFDCSVICDWDIVPNHVDRAATETFVGVVAFHQNGIDNVRFSVNGGEWLEVTQMALNPMSGAWEYSCAIDLSDQDHGDLLEVRAIVTPAIAGPPVGLDPRMLRVDRGEDPVYWCAPWGDDDAGDGSEEAPYRQPGRALQAHQSAAGGTAALGACDGVRVHLKAGEYEATASSLPYPSTEHAWVAIAAAPGVPPEDVVFREGGGIRTRWVKFEGLTFDDMTVPSRVLPGGEKQWVWLDGCRLIGTGAHDGRNPINSNAFAGVFVTDSEFSDLSDGPKFADLVRNTVVRRVGSDAYTGGKLVLNCEAHEMDPSPGAHSDIYQVFCPTSEDAWPGSIVYGLIATGVPDQGIFLSDCAAIRNVALVNILLVRVQSASPGTAPYSQLRAPEVRNILFENVTIANQAFLFKSDDCVDVTVRSSVFAKCVAIEVPPGSIGGHGNHFVDTSSFGATVIGDGHTFGSLGCADTVLTSSGLFGSPSDYVEGLRPLPSSAVAGRVFDTPVPADTTGQEKAAASAAGALEP